jgi:hypothetical protein
MIGHSVLVGLVINARRNREVPFGTRELLTEKPKQRFSMLAYVWRGTRDAETSAS